MSLKKISIIIFTSVVLVTVLYLLFLICISWPIANLSVSQTASFGDSFGIINSLFSGLAFAGLIVTIIIQRQELTESRNVFKSQKFEDAFYRLLEFYKTNLNEISVHDNTDDKYYKGVGGLSYQIRKLSSHIHAYSKNLRNNIDNETHNVLLFAAIQKTLIPQSRYLGTLESILYLIMNELDNKQDRHFYLKILASQLTVHEIRYIFYRCLVSNTDAPLVELVNDSKVIEARIPESRLNKMIVRLYNERHGTELEAELNYAIL